MLIFYVFVLQPCSLMREHDVLHGVYAALQVVKRTRVTRFAQGIDGELATLALLADKDGILVRVEFLDSTDELSDRDDDGVRESENRAFMRFAHVDDGHRVAIVDLLGEFFRSEAFYGDFVFCLQSAKIFVVNFFDVCNRRVVAANRAVAIPFDLEDSRGQIQTVDVQKLSVQVFADTQNQFERFVSLDAAHNAWEWADGTAFGTGGNES